MNFSSIAKYGGLVVAAGAVLSLLFSLDYLFNDKSSLLPLIAICSGVLATRLIASVFGEIAAQFKRRYSSALCDSDCAFIRLESASR